MNKKIIFPLIGCAALLLSMNQGLLKVSSFPSLTQLEEGFNQEEQISLSLKALTAEEAKECLNGDIVGWGYQPIQVTIKNQSPDPYLFSPDSIGLSLIDPKKVAKEIIKSSIPRAIGFKIASLIFWPFSIPSTVDSLMTLKIHREMKKNLTSKAVRLEVIPSYSSFNRVFFVYAGDLKESFSITLQNQETLEDRVFLVEGPKELQTLAPEPVIAENYYLTHES